MDTSDLWEFYEDDKTILHSNCIEMEGSPQDRTYCISLCCVS